MCTVFFVEDCDRSDQDDWSKFGSGGYWTIQDGISGIYRSYMCEEAFCSVVTDMGRTDPSLCEKEHDEAGLSWPGSWLMLKEDTMALHRGRHQLEVTHRWCRCCVSIEQTYECIWKVFTHQEPGRT